MAGEMTFPSALCKHRAPEACNSLGIATDKFIGALPSFSGHRKRALGVSGPGLSTPTSLYHRTPLGLLRGQSLPGNNLSWLFTVSMLQVRSVILETFSDKVPGTRRPTSTWSWQTSQQINYLSQRAPLYRKANLWIHSLAIYNLSIFILWTSAMDQESEKNHLLSLQQCFLSLQQCFLTYCTCKNLLKLDTNWMGLSDLYH